MVEVLVAWSDLYAFAQDGAASGNLNRHTIWNEDYAMIAIDESDLIEFFSALPQSQPAEEVEFFAAPCFVKVVDGIRLEFSASAHFDDVRLHLQLDGSDVPLVESVLHDVESIAIELDPDARKWIHAWSRTGQEFRLAVEPSISVQLTAGRSTT